VSASHDPPISLSLPYTAVSFRVLIVAFLKKLTILSIQLTLCMCTNLTCLIRKGGGKKSTLTSSVLRLSKMSTTCIISELSSSLYLIRGWLCSNRCKESNRDIRTIMRTSFSYVGNPLHSLLRDLFRFFADTMLTRALTCCAASVCVFLSASKRSLIRVTCLLHVLGVGAPRPTHAVQGFTSLVAHPKRTIGIELLTPLVLRIARSAYCFEHQTPQAAVYGGKRIRDDVSSHVCLRRQFGVTLSAAFTVCKVTSFCAMHTSRTEGMDIIYTAEHFQDKKSAAHPYRRKLFWTYSTEFNCSDV
jgi:hypothetical protein